MTLDLTPTPAPVDRRIPSARRLAALTRLIDAAPELDVNRAAALIDAAAASLETGTRPAALAVLELAAPLEAARLVDLLTLG